MKSLGARAGLFDGTIARISLLGSDKTVTWRQDSDALVIESPTAASNDVANVFKIEPRN